MTTLKSCRYGDMLFLSRDSYIGRSLSVYGEYSHGEIALFEQLLTPGHVVVEVGANIGAHTVRLSQLVGETGQVHAFEPQRVIHQLLCANLALNECFNTSVYREGVAAAVGTMLLPSIDYAQAGNFGGVSLLPSVPAASNEAVPVRMLDSLELPSLRLLKIDCEGMEHAVLSGARRLLARHRPMLYVENDRQAQSSALIRLIQEQGYRLWWHVPPLYNPDNHARNATNLYEGVASYNMLCVPADNAVSMVDFREVLGPDDWPFRA